MDQALWKKVEAICLAALAHPPAKRAAFIAGATAGDPILRREVELQIAAYEQSSGFLETPLASLRHLESAEPLGSGQLGSYRLVRLLARGGMGEVFLGVQETASFSRPVAIKLIRMELEKEDALARFRR
ncbi:Serine/threonine-protein kinase PknD [bacterium HR33]|nr:Serine/threonine-protein kinase PknD [bacterium HR33]